MISAVMRTCLAINSQDQPAVLQKQGLKQTSFSHGSIFWESSCVGWEHTTTTGVHWIEGDVSSFFFLFPSLFIFFLKNSCPVRFVFTSLWANTNSVLSQKNIISKQ